MKKLDNKMNRSNNKRTVKLILCLVAFFLIFGVVSSNISEKKEREKAQETARIEQEKRDSEIKQKEEEKALAYSTIDGWIEYNKDDIKANFDDENNIMYVTLQFGKSLSVDSRISMANQKMYDITKELESLFKDDIDKYMFNCEATLTDSYGNKENSVVYSIILDRKELNKVNWDGIEPSMLINLASKNYKSPTLN